MADSKSNPLSQVLVAVVIAVLVGGTSPWWWKEFFAKQSTQQPSIDRPGDSEADMTNTSAPVSDFPEGSIRVYSAQFQSWQTINNQYGSCGFEQGEYALKPNSNTWIGASMPTDPISGDFVFDANFRVPTMNPDATLQLEILGQGQDADYVSVILEINRSNRASYTIDKGWIQDNYLKRDKMIATGVALPPTSVADWTQTNKITFKREKGTLQVFFNDVHLKSFTVSLFTIGKVSVSAATPSTVAISSLEGRSRSK